MSRRIAQFDFVRTSDNGECVKCQYEPRCISEFGSRIGSKDFPPVSSPLELC